MVNAVATNLAHYGLTGPSAGYTTGSQYNTQTSTAAVNGGVALAMMDKLGML